MIGGRYSPVSSALNKVAVVGLGPQFGSRSVWLILERGFKMATSDEIITRLLSYTATELNPIARAVLEDDTASVIGRQSCESVAGLSMGPGTLGIARLEGNARTGSGVKPWSVVVKALEFSDESRSTVLHVSPDKEVSAYENDLISGGGTGMRAARCYRIDRHPDHQTWLWIEDLSKWIGPPWNLTDYVRASRDIGQFSGHWATDPDPSFYALPMHIGIAGTASDHTKVNF